MSSADLQIEPAKTCISHPADSRLHPGWNDLVRRTIVVLLCLIKGFCTAGKIQLSVKLLHCQAGPTRIDAHGPPECRPTRVFRQSAARNLCRLNELGRLRCYGIAMVQ